MKIQTIVRTGVSLTLYFIATQLMENDNPYEKLAIMILIMLGVAIQEHEW